MTEVTPEETVRRIEPKDPQRVRPDVRPDIGWQSPPLPRAEQAIACPHMGRIGAALQSAQYALGTEWICVCGQVFVVAINAGGKQTLLKPEDVPSPDLPLPAEEPVVDTPAAPEPPVQSAPLAPVKLAPGVDKGGSTRA